MSYKTLKIDTPIVVLIVGLLALVIVFVPFVVILMGLFAFIIGLIGFIKSKKDTIALITMIIGLLVIVVAILVAWDKIDPVTISF